jgi:ornithine cyclodeaminase/alanine dehydrogenase-like protein (mu-crystallin family)
MSVLILNHEEVSRLLTIEECIEVMAGALAGLARGEAHQPLRTAAVPPGAAGVLGLMPAYKSGSSPLFGLKAVCVFPGNSAKGLDSHQGAVLLFSGETGQLLSLMDASAITAIRTAAVSAVATRLLARQDAGILAIIGAGVQARVHLLAMKTVRKIRRATVVSRNAKSAQAFAEQMSAEAGFPIEPSSSIEQAVNGADLIVTATTAREPILKREWISAGAHLNVVGSSVRTTREVDSATMAAARLFVDRRESTLNEAGDYLFAAREGAIGPEHIEAEIGELLIGERQGRTSDDEITLFKSLGLGIEDLASAEYLYHKARSAGAGTTVRF